MLLVDEYLFENGYFTPLVLTDVLLLFIILAAIVYTVTVFREAIRNENGTR